MFKALMPLLAQCKALDLKIIPGEDGSLQVILIPTAKDGYSVKGTPAIHHLVGTAEELDAELAGGIQLLADGRISLKESVETELALLASAQQASEAAAATTLSKSASTSQCEADDEDVVSSNEQSALLAGGTQSPSTAILF